MRIRALKTTSGTYGLLPRGGIAEVPDWEAREMIAIGYAIEELPIEKKAAAPQNVKLAADVEPFTDAPTGGAIGEEKQPSSLRRGRQRRSAQ